MGVEGEGVPSIPLDASLFIGRASLRVRRTSKMSSRCAIACIPCLGLSGQLGLWTGTLPIPAVLILAQNPDNDYALPSMPAETSFESRPNRIYTAKAVLLIDRERKQDVGAEKRTKIRSDSAYLPTDAIVIVPKSYSGILFSLDRNMGKCALFSC